MTSTEPTGYSFDLRNKDLIEGLRKIQGSHAADISIVFGGLANNPEILFLPYESKVPPGAKEPPAQGQETPQTEPEVALVNDHSRAANLIHAFGSYTKVVIAYAILSLVEKRGDHTMLKESPEDFINIIRKQRDPRARKVVLRVKTTILGLMRHLGGYTPLNKMFFAPDGTFLFGEEEFLSIDATYMKLNFAGKEDNYAYSNGNYILLALILKLSLEMSLQEALEELVFNDLEMRNSRIDLDGLADPEREDRLVQGFQLSAKGHRTAVDSQNLLKDTIEAGAMGLRSTLNDITKFNLALVGKHHKESPAFPPPKFRFNFFLGKQSSFGGLFSIPAEGVFLSETPITMLESPGYKPTSLGSLRKKTTTREKIQDKTSKPFETQTNGIPDLVVQKAGYIDGHSCNIIVFPDARDFLIIVANATGASDVVHHISRFLMQEILDLTPTIGSLGEDATRETAVRSQVLAALEQSNLRLDHQLHKPEKHLLGTYRHQHWPQEIVIQADGYVIFQARANPGGPQIGRKRSSPMPMAYEGGTTDTIRLYIDAPCLPIDGWSVWRDLTFKIVNRDGRTGLSHDNKADEYWKL